MSTRIIHAEMPEVRVIGLSMFEHAEGAEAMRRAGAVDYVTKSGAAGILVAAIRCSVLGIPEIGEWIALDNAGRDI